MAFVRQQADTEHGNFAIEYCTESVKKLSEVLRKIRRDRNLSQENLADEIGVDYTTYNRYEKDPSKIQVETLEKIAKVYNMSLRELVNYTSEDKPSAHGYDLKAFQLLVANLAPQFISDKATPESKTSLYKAAFELMQESSGYFLAEVQATHSPKKKKKQ